MQNKWNGLGFLNNDIYQQATNQTRERHIFDDFEHDTNLEIVTILFCMIIYIELNAKVTHTGY